MVPSANAGSARSAGLSMIARVAIFADSTSGWSKGLMPSSRPATAVAYSQVSSWEPRVPVISISSGATWRVSSQSPTRRMI